jgi:hypothetical protein
MKTEVEQLREEVRLLKLQVRDLTNKLYAKNREINRRSHDDYEFVDFGDGHE